MPNHLSQQDAQKLILLSQGLYAGKQAPSGKLATFKVIEQLNYVQIDSISVVQRAHHHSLWNRVDNYSPSHIEELLADKKIFEYWSHAAAYLPINNYRFSLPRKQAFKQGEKHWFKQDKKAQSMVLKRITEEGPLQAKDFKDTRQNKSGWWDWKPAKKALEQLYMQGDLMVLKRQGFQKVYDLTERVLPAKIDSSVPTEEEYCQHLIRSYLKANAVGNLEQISYLLKGIKIQVKQQCWQMCEQGLLLSVNIDGQDYFALPSIDKLLQQRLNSRRVKILSPFDNLVIQRKRIKNLFNYDYQIECYVPESKRKYGYFCLPLLWGKQFAARMDVKMDRKLATLNIKHLHLETHKIEEFILALKKTLKNFLVFNEAKSVTFTKITHAEQKLSKAKIKYYSNILIN